MKKKQAEKMETSRNENAISKTRGMSYKGELANEHECKKSRARIKNEKITGRRNMKDYKREQKGAPRMVLVRIDGRGDWDPR